MSEEEIKEVRKDVKKYGKEILGRKLTEEEIEENTQALLDYYEILLAEDCDGDEEAAYDLFNEDFYDKLTEYLEMEEEEED